MIVDQFGRPLEKKALAEPQTAKISHLHQEFAGHPSRGLTPAKLAAIMERAEQGWLMEQHDLFIDMEEKDGHILAEMSKRKRALISLPWCVEAREDANRAEKKAADQLTEILGGLPDLEDMLLDLADAIGHGFSCVEIEWRREQGLWLPKQFHFRPQSWFITPIGSRNELRLRDFSAEGQELLAFGWIAHIHRARSGYLARAGLHRSLAWPYLYKNYAVRDMAEFLEIFGIPMRLGVYHTNATEEEKNTLLRAVTALGHNAAGIIPEGMSIDFKQAMATTGDPFSGMIDWCERTQSKVIVGATLTAQTGGVGSQALGNIHHEVMWDLIRSDARQIQGSVSRQLLWPLVALNMPGIASMQRCPAFRFDLQEADDLNLFADSLPKLVSVGVQIPEKWAREKLLIPEPEEGEPVLAVATHAPAPPSRGGAEAVKTRSAALRNAPDLNPADLTAAIEASAVDQSSRWLAQLGPFMDSLMALLDETQDIELFRDRLSNLLGEPAPDALVDSLVRTGFAAGLAGAVE